MFWNIGCILRSVLPNYILATIFKTYYSEEYYSRKSRWMESKDQCNPLVFNTPACLSFFHYNYFTYKIVYGVSQTWTKCSSSTLAMTSVIVYIFLPFHRPKVITSLEKRLYPLTMKWHGRDWMQSMIRGLDSTEEEDILIF